MNHVLIALGSNLGNKRKNLNSAISSIATRIGVVSDTASFHVTAPIGDAADQEFLNSALICETSLDPEAVLDELLAIEIDLGRVRTEHWGNRIIDLDVLLYKDSCSQQVCVSSEKLTIPHPFMHERAFVLDPACEIASTWIHPKLNKSLKKLKKSLI